MEVEEMSYKVLVVGTGQMGSGIAQACAQGGCETYITDVSTEVANKGLDKIKHFVHHKVEKGKIDEDAYNEIIGRVHVVENYKAAGDVDMAIEVVSENLDLKKKIFKALDEAVPERTIIASNTSTYSITALGGVTKRQDRVVGLHFFIPAPVMKLVEVTRGLNTSDETFAFAMQFAKDIGKTPVKSPDSSGFIVNRLYSPFENEAAFLVQEGVSPEDIDTAVKLGLNHPMGPCELSDFAGIDTVLSVLTEMYDNTGDPKYRPCPLLKKMVAAGMYGRKSGKGYYDYTNK